MDSSEYHFRMIFDHSHCQNIYSQGQNQYFLILSFLATNKWHKVKWGQNCSLGNAQRNTVYICSGFPDAAPQLKSDVIHSLTQSQPRTAFLMFQFGKSWTLHLKPIPLIDISKITLHRILATPNPNWLWRQIWSWRKSKYGPLLVREGCRKKTRIFYGLLPNRGGRVSEGIEKTILLFWRKEKKIR